MDTFMPIVKCCPMVKDVEVLPNYDTLTGRESSDMYGL